MTLVFYDIETTIPATDIIEFGAIVLDNYGFYEKESYSTLIRSDQINQRSIDCNGITPKMVRYAPEFHEVADQIFNILDKRIWAGHNIKSFDNPHIIKQFEKIGRKPPEPIGIIDTLPLLRNTFGTRCGDLKMATLGNYFGLGQERHRAIEDCRMTIEVLKNCSMTLFLEENSGYDASLKPDSDESATRRDEQVIYSGPYKKDSMLRCISNKKGDTKWVEKNIVIS